MTPVPAHLQLHRDDDIARVRLDRPPVNGLNHGLLAELRDALAELREDDAVRGVLLGSASERAFSAGLDLQEIAGYGGAEGRAFAELFLDLLHGMAGYPKPLVAALPGHAIAGGLLLAATADVRVAAAGSYKIVMSEVDLGIPVPRPDVALITHLVGESEAHRVLLEGHVYDPAEAVRVGLVDDVVAPGELEATALERLRVLAGKDPDAFARIKANLRAPLVEAMAAHRDAALAEALDILAAGAP